LAAAKWALRLETRTSASKHFAKALKHRNISAAAESAVAETAEEATSFAEDTAGDLSR
jgi:hypothetical protein